MPATLQTLPEVAAALAVLVGEILCDSCGHELRRHLDIYGCEQEMRDPEGDHPCDCHPQNPADIKIVALLRLHKGLHG